MAFSYNYRTNVGVKSLARSAAEDRAIRKYEREKIDKVLVRFPKGKKEIIQKIATNRGESLNAFINRAVDRTIKEEVDNM